MIARSLFAAALALALFSAGCHKATVVSYTIPKEKDPEMPLAMGPGAGGGPAAAPASGDTSGGGAMANTTVPTAEGPGLIWSAPADWKPTPGSPMRKGSYAVPGNGGADGDLSITAFPGDVGGELANVNRWRGQVQLPPISEADLATQVQQLQSNGLTLSVVDVAGTGAGANAILGAIIPYNGNTWFVKLDGPTPVVAKAKPEFLAFLKTIKPSAPAAQ